MVGRLVSRNQSKSYIGLAQIAILGVLALFAAGAAIAHAQTETPPVTLPSETTASSADETASSTASTTTTIPAVPPGPPPALSPTQQTRVINLAANITNQLEAVITRLYTISDRLNRRLDTFAEAGIETGVARARLIDAERIIAEAERTLSTIDRDVFAVATSPTPRTTWPLVRAKYARTKKHLITGQAALAEAIALTRSAANQ